MSLPPSGEIPQGAIRFNTDSQKLEFYAQGEWWVMSTDTPNLGRSVDSTPGARGIFAGGFPYNDVIDYINVSSTGNAIAFDTLTAACQMIGAGCGSRTRGLFGGQTAPSSNVTVDGVETVSYTHLTLPTIMPV